MPPRTVTLVLGRFALLLLVALGASACSRPLPEPESEAAKLYALRCNNCHRVYHPTLMTAKMWETMVSRMETDMARTGTPLAPGEKAVILEYLKRNAAKP